MRFKLWAYVQIKLNSSAIIGLQPEPNLIATQLTVQIPFSMDVIFESGSFIKRDEELSGDEYTKSLEKNIANFDKRFEETFELEKKG